MRNVPSSVELCVNCRQALYSNLVSDIGIGDLTQVFVLPR